MARMKWTEEREYQAEDGEWEVEEIHHELPARWEICNHCSGDGSHSRHIGAITYEDRQRDWSDDEFDFYMRGGYDKQCEECKGSGKVLVPDFDRWPDNVRKAYNDEQAAWASIKAEEEAERRYFYGPNY